MKQAILCDYVLKNDLKKFRQAARLSQSQLAFKCGTTQVTISAIENGEYKSPSLLLAFKISQVLGYRIEDIFYIVPKYLY